MDPTPHPMFGILKPIFNIRDLHAQGMPTY